jgi:adenylate cyclase
LRGLAFLHRFGKRSQRFALEMFHEALTLEPDYAPAWAGVATSRVLLYLHSEATDEHKRLALEAGARAIELDPLSAEAHVAWATAATLRGEYRVADAAFERAQTLNPRLFEAWYFHGRSCAARGEHERAVVLYEKAARTRPEDYQALDLAVQSYRSLGRHAEARHAAARCIAAAEKIVSLYPSDVRALSMCACVLPELERFEEARRWTERACALEPEESFVHYNAACTYVLLGDYERAFDHLERVGVEILADRDWIEQDSALDAVRDHPRYKTFLSRAR